jgi:alpha-L-rhamnosidase
VRVQGNDDVWTEWKQLYVEAGLLERSDWTAVPISTPPTSLTETKRPFRVRQTFTVPSSGSRARLYITALGLYEAHLNGKRIGEDLLTPGWTSYYARIPYQTYDVTELLTPGENVLGAWVGEGWYAGTLGYHGGTKNIYGERIGLIAQLEVNGEVIAKTNEEWQWSYGSVISSEIYNGEEYDARLGDTDFADGDWEAVEALPFPSAKLFSSQAPTVRSVQTVKPVEIITTPSGKTVIDFGQNFGGVVKIVGTPPSSGVLVLRHAEVLEHGELGDRPLRYAKCTDTIRLSNRSVTGYSPKFTFHGFRYVEVTGWPGITLSDLEGVVMQSAMERAGTFECSHRLVNRLYENCVWSTMANTISVPTDCPQRDERLGWTGDICVFSPTMSYLFDTGSFMGEWLKDLAHDQNRLNGVVPIFVPDTGTDFSYPEAIWGDASVLTPWDTFTATADLHLLEKQYDSVKLWLSRGVLRDPHTGLWSREQDQLGDWLAPKAPPETPNMGPTDDHLVADAWLIHSTKTASKIARAIGRDDEADVFATTAEGLTEAFYREYVTAGGRLVSDTQTALALIIRYDIFPAPLNGAKSMYRQRFAQRLVHLVKRANWQVDTGFAGTPIILQTLAQIGAAEHAYRMLQAKECPSWLATVLLGATTIWERWDSMLSDGTINPGEMTSFNHYALGSVASFMHECVGGLRVVEGSGWKQVLVKPEPGGTITSAKTSHNSPLGVYAVDWRMDNGKIMVQVVVPPGGSAEVVIPGWPQGKREMKGSGTWTWEESYNTPDFPPKVYEPHFAPVRPNEWVP